MVNNKRPGGGEKESGNGLVHAMQRTGPQAKSLSVDAGAENGVRDRNDCNNHGDNSNSTNDHSNNSDNSTDNDHGDGGQRRLRY